jgi:hypothetical protein
VFDLVCQNFLQNIHTGLQYDYFLRNQKDLESKTILSKIFCNMHIVRRNMHIAIESILPLTYDAGAREKDLQQSAMSFGH